MNLRLSLWGTLIKLAGADECRCGVLLEGTFAVGHGGSGGKGTAGAPGGHSGGPQEDAAVLCDPGHTSLPCLGECPWSHRAPAVFEPPARAADSARLGFLPLGELADEKKL